MIKEFDHTQLVDLLMRKMEQVVTTAGCLDVVLKSGPCRIDSPRTRHSLRFTRRDGEPCRIEGSVGTYSAMIDTADFSTHTGSVLRLSNVMEESDVSRNIARFQTEVAAVVDELALLESGTTSQLLTALGSNIVEVTTKLTTQYAKAGKPASQSDQTEAKLFPDTRVSNSKMPLPPGCSSEMG